MMKSRKSLFKKQKYFLLLAFAFIFFKGVSQNDSLTVWKKAVDSGVNEEKKLSLFVKISKELFLVDPKQSIKYSEMGEKVAIKQNDTNSLSEIYLTRSIALRELNQFKEALDCNLKGLKIAEELKDTLLIGEAYDILGIFYHVTGSLKQAEKYYLKALNVFNSNNDLRGIYITYNNLSDIYSTTNRQKLAEDALTRSLQARKQTGDARIIGIGYYALAYYFGNNKKNLLALNVLDSAIAYIQKAADDFYFAQAMVLKGECLTSSKKYRESNDVLQPLLIDNKLIKENLDMLDGVYTNMSRNYEGLNQTAEALKYARLEKSVSDSIFKLENLKSLSEAQAKFDTEKQEQQIDHLNAEKKINESELNRQKIIRNTFLFGSIVFLLFAALIFRSLQINRKSKKVIEFQKEELEIKNKEVLDSIHYAQRIQSALMAHAGLLKTNIKEHFILFKPKDIVSGDFYWATKKDNRLYIAVCDSTGHGVPGAFMSLLNINFLNEAINEKNISLPNEIFNYVRKKLIENISQDGAQDGMDGILICITSTANDTTKVTYSAANNNPLLYQDGELAHLTTDKMPIGKGEKTEEFKLFEIENHKDSIIYLYTDGYADQFGGPKGKKFKDKNLNSLINSIALLPLAEQEEKLDSAFQSWKNALEQVDDVCVVGIKL